MLLVTISGSQIVSIWLVNLKDSLAIEEPLGPFCTYTVASCLLVFEKNGATRNSMRPNAKGPHSVLGVVEFLVAHPLCTVLRRRLNVQSRLYSRICVSKICMCTVLFFWQTSPWDKIEKMSIQ